MSKTYLLLKLEMLSANSEEKTPQTWLNALTQGPGWCCHGGIAQAVGASVSLLARGRRCEANVKLPTATGRDREAKTDRDEWRRDNNMDRWREK